MSQASSQFETETRVDVRTLPGYRWDESGQSVLSGALLDLYRRIDNMFLRWAGDCQAPEFFFPTFISAHELGKLDYFRSFPHLVTFPAVLDASETNLKSFAEGEPLDSQGCVHLTALDSVRNVLTPALDATLVSTAFEYLIAPEVKARFIGLAAEEVNVVLAHEVFRRIQRIRIVPG